MHYQTFGRLTGLRVSEYALGTANFGTSGTSAGPEASRQIFEAFAAAGGTTLDTSNLYQDGQAETVLGELLGRQRDDFVVITKYSGTRQDQPRPGTTGNSRKVMVRSLEASLRRLNTHYVDVFMPHFPDGTTPVEEILAGLDDLIRSGKILHGGLSNFPAWRVASAAVRADLRGLAPLVGIQAEYSLAERSADRELLPMAQAHGLGMVLYSPLAGGLLTGKYRQGEQGRLSSRGDAIESTAQRTAVVDAVLAIADEAGASAAQVSLASAPPGRTGPGGHDPDRRPPLPDTHEGIPKLSPPRAHRPALPMPGRGQRGPPGSPARRRRDRAEPRLRRRPHAARTIPRARHLITARLMPRRSPDPSSVMHERSLPLRPTSMTGP
jgi:aryl-alcohol dehydrogenase-like predicted oxidoreductase